MSFKSAMNSLATGINKNADIIMTVTALIGLASTIALAIKATPEAENILGDAKERIDRIENGIKHHDISEMAGEAEIKDVKKNAAGKLAINYIPTAISFVGTSVCIIGSTKINRGRNATLTGMLNAANVAYNEYRDHVKEAIGEKKEREIYDDIRREHIEKNPPPRSSDVISTGDGNVLCHIEVIPDDPTSGLYFYSSPEAVYKAINEANAEGIESGYVSMGDLLYFMNIKLKGYPNFIGWSIRSRNDLIEIRPGSHIYNDQPVFDISFVCKPYGGFDRFG